MLLCVNWLWEMNIFKVEGVYIFCIKCDIIYCFDSLGGDINDI